jgi:cellulose synthase/poly-beta-1,6-N-acetylglucosamine synthase-like glycosyltransferase
MYWLAVILILPYVLLLLKIYRGLLKLKIFKVSTDPVTFASIIIACRNEQKNLPHLLDCLATQNYSDDLFEVIIVNDNSTDKTYEIAGGFKRITNLLTIDNKGEGKKQALRTGIKAARGNLIITTDADCTMGKNWIRTIASYYEISKPELIICPVQLESVPRIFGRLQELEFLSLQGITAGSAISDEATICNGANLAFNREVYLDHSYNLHDEIKSGDDIFLLHSLKKGKRSKILWMESPDAIVTTASSPSIGSFLRQRSRWISKGKSFKDRSTNVLGIVTFVAVIVQISYLISSMICPALIWVFLSVVILKSIPDYLILKNTSGRYDRKKLMSWFLPAQLIYPFYVLSVVFYSLTISSPSRKGT